MSSTECDCRHLTSVGPLCQGGKVRGQACRKRRPKQPQRPVSALQKGRTCGRSARDSFVELRQGAKKTIQRPMRIGQSIARVLRLREVVTRAERRGAAQQFKKQKKERGNHRFRASASPSNPENLTALPSTSCSVRCAYESGRRIACSVSTWPDAFSSCEDGTTQDTSSIDLCTLPPTRLEQKRKSLTDWGVLPPGDLA